MAFEHKPGQGSLFKNEDRDKDTDPWYRGSGKLEDGTDVWINAWVNEAKNGNKYMSIRWEKKQAKPALKPEDVDDSDIPF